MSLQETSANNPQTWDCRWSPLDSCILKAISANTSLPTAGKKKSIPNWILAKHQFLPALGLKDVVLTFRFRLADRQIYLQVWQVRVGRVNLYLLDTNISDNRPEDRGLSARLYTADQEERLRQLIVLGIGGVRALRELHIDPIVWHANEDHTAFMMLERLREERVKGTPLNEAIEKIRKNTVFTTHTPVAAGHHIFPYQLMDRYCSKLLGKSQKLTEIAS